MEKYKREFIKNSQRYNNIYVCMYICTRSALFYKEKRKLEKKKKLHRAPSHTGDREQVNGIRTRAKKKDGKPER